MDYKSGLEGCQKLIKSSQYQLLDEEKWVIHYAKGLCHSKLNQTIVALKELIAASKYKKIEKSDDLLKETAKKVEEIDVKGLKKMLNPKEFCQNLFGIDDTATLININQIAFPVISHFYPPRGQQSKVYNIINVIKEKLRVLRTVWSLIASKCDYILPLFI